jgi:hypothetical protein
VIRILRGSEMRCHDEQQQRGSNRGQRIHGTVETVTRVEIEGSSSSQVDISDQNSHVCSSFLPSVTATLLFGSQRDPQAQIRPHGRQLEPPIRRVHTPVELSRVRRTAMLSRDHRLQNSDLAHHLNSFLGPAGPITSTTPAFRHLTAPYTPNG